MTFSSQLLAWFDLHGRKDLPWQQQPSPYHVWLSEIMLQQTQVNTVIPYYQRFTAKYNDLDSLASAPLDDVLALWTGLGYYARARNLHKAAIIMQQQYNSELPQDLEKLIALPGIGRSTAGAIMSLAHQQRFAILDGNVKRVLARYNCVTGWPGNKKVENKLWSIAEQLLPENRFANYIQAQMDLGATLCTRTKPKCEICPLKANCQAFLSDIPQNYPESKPKKIIPTRYIHWIIMQCSQGKVLLQQQPPAGIWGGLWIFPQVETLENIEDLCLNKYQVNIKSITAVASFKHVFSHFKLEVQPQLVFVDNNHSNIAENNNSTWYRIDEALQLGLPAPVKNFLQSLPKMRN